MGSHARPIVGTTAAGAGATYIMLDRYAEKVNVSLTVNGTVTDYDVDTTLDNIQFGGAGAAGAGNAQFVNNPSGERVAPASAAWVVTSVNAASAAAQLALTSPVFALRILINAGTGSVSYRILQTG